MNFAPDRGAGNQLTEKGPRRRQPTKAHKQSTRDGDLDSAPALNHQDPRLVRTRGEKRILSGNVVYQTTRDESSEGRDRRIAAGARAGHVLSQMRDWIKFQGLRHPAPEHQHAYLEVAASQYRAVRASRPRWSYGILRWAKRYAPDIWRTRSPAYIESLVLQHGREETYLEPEQIGRLLGVTHEAYTALKLTDIWPAGMTAEERARDQRVAKLAWQRADDLAKGRVKNPHAQSLARTRPWEPMGISESTWKRRRKRGEL